MNIFQKRIENLCDEIIGRILALMKVNSVSEVILTDNDNPVYVIWFDKTGDPCECSVHKVTAVGKGITIEVHDKITGENYKVTSRHEAALANPVWLNDIKKYRTGRKCYMLQMWRKSCNMQCLHQSEYKTVL